MNNNPKAKMSSHVKQSESNNNSKLTKREKDKLRKQKEKNRLNSKRSGCQMNPKTTLKEESNLKNPKHFETHVNEIKEAEDFANLNFPIHICQDSQHSNKIDKVSFTIHVSEDNICSNVDIENDVFTKNEFIPSSKNIDESCISDLLGIKLLKPDMAFWPFISHKPPDE